MNYLRKTIWAVGLIILLKLLKVFFDWIFPASRVFNHNILSSLQVIILFWLIISLISGLISPRINGKMNLLVLLLVIAIPELVFTYWIHHPSKIPSAWRSSFRYYCTESETNIIQLNPEYSVYDSGLFYTLKPSSNFVFDNPEFADSFHTNKMGLRDDDSSLVKPEVICLGDSYAMGWGVEQNGSFAELLSKRTGKKVLNAAISSYGTAREMKMLSRVDSSNLQTIILQYGRNDLRENKELVENNYALKISPGKTYEESVNEHYWSKVWFPGKRFITMFKFYAQTKLAGVLSRKKNEPADSSLFLLQQEARYFTDILMHSSINFKKIKVLVVDLNQKISMNNDLVNEVNKLLQLPVYKEHFNNNLIMVPVAELFTEDDYYILDYHLRPSGHRKLAERLANYF